MYSKYEEMCVVRQILNGYVNMQKQNYDMQKESFKQLANGSLDISDKNQQSSLNMSLSIMNGYSSDYEKGVKVLAELKKSTLCYEMAYTQENIQSGLADERAKEGNRIYFELKTKNQNYKSIMDEISMDLWKKDENLQDLGLDFDTKAERLEEAYANGKISKEQLIYYEIMCSSLMNNPDYVDYMQQFQQPDLHGGIKK